MRYQLFPNLTADEMEALTADIAERGVMVPVEIDEQGAILDGHHRMMIADSLGLEYPTVVRRGWTEEQKFAHVVALNAHRRHLTPLERREVIHNLRMQGMSTRAIGKAVAVDPKTVRNDLGRGDVSPPAMVTGTDGKSYPASRPRLDPTPDPYFTRIVAAAGVTPIIVGLSEGSSALAPEPEKWQPSPALMSSDSPEWYTPKRVLDAVVEAMGAIDLDPCADSGRTVPATVHYTEDDDGLAQEWAGRVYMNPPYGRGIGDWTTKLADALAAGSVSEAIALVPARTETDWWESLEAEWICLIHGRLAFSDHLNAAPFPSAALYLGQNGEAFHRAFTPLGRVYQWRR